MARNIEEFLAQDERKDLLRFLTAGSVDDGKSTLIGRLLYDSKKLYEDQLDALERDSKRCGNAGDHIDYALLCDGLKAEREQGITVYGSGCQFVFELVRVEKNFPQELEFFFVHCMDVPP